MLLTCLFGNMELTVMGEVIQSEQNVADLPFCGQQRAEALKLAL